MSWRPIKAVEWIVIHCSATPALRDIGVKEIDAYHKKKGWRGVGYHFVIRRNGVIEKGRPEDAPGAHVRGLNHASLGICLIGGNPEGDFSDAQERSLRSLVDELKLRYPDAKVIGHRDVPGVNKTCPTFDVGEFFARPLDTGG